jgi:hypothetical protein
MALAYYRQTLKYVTNTMKSQRNNSLISYAKEMCPTGKSFLLKTSRNSNTGAPG